MLEIVISFQFTSQRNYEQLIHDNVTQINLKSDRSKDCLAPNMYDLIGRIENK